MRAARQLSVAKSRRIDGAVATKLTERGRKIIESANEKYAGNSSTNTMSSGHETPASGSSSQPRANSASMLGATSERRRLSVIFQRCSVESGLAVRTPCVSGT